MLESTLISPSFLDVSHPPTAWQSYHYTDGGHTYIPVQYDPAGGPENRPSIWVNDLMWTIDTPEQPHSILALIYYRDWCFDGPLNLSRAKISCRLRGDNLQLHGAKCYFWIVSYTPRVTRWHYIHHPIPICHNGWGEPTEIPLLPNQELWHRSFSADRGHPSPLGQTLRTCFSYGFSFVGFSKKVTGRLGLADFTITTPVDPHWPFSFNNRHTEPRFPWMTVSRKHRRQVEIDHPSNQRPEFPAPSATKGLYLKDDFLLFQETKPAFAYLAYVRAEHSTKGRNLHNAIVLVRHTLDGFNAHNGKVVFFVEHAASNTRWVLWSAIENTDRCPWYNILANEERHWQRLSGDQPLREVLAGKEGQAGYDYFGLLIVGSTAVPEGRWELSQFSIGPAIDA